MVRPVLRSVLVVFVMIGILGAVGPTSTYSLFSDSHDSAGGLTAEANFDTGSSGDSGDQAYNDADNDGQYDEGETKHNASDLYNFNDTTTNLVIPDSVGNIDAGNKQDVSIRAKNISSEVSIESKNSDVSLTATDGGIKMGGTGVSIDGGQGEVTISATKDINLTGSTIVTNSQNVRIETDGRINVDNAKIEVEGGQGSITLVGQTISARNADFDTETGDITLAATNDGGGQLDANNANFAVGGGQGAIKLSSTGNMNLDGAALTTNTGSATANLGISSATLSVDGTVVNHANNDPLRYSPSNVTESPDNPNVESS